MNKDVKAFKDSFLTIKEKASAEHKVQKSRFIAQAYPVSRREDIQDIINGIKKVYYDASHHPYAYRLGLSKDDFRYSDDGEPSGSAGKPILEAIDKFGLTDVLVVITRYFGGVKLGVGGLRRAIGEAAELCLQTAVIEERLIYQRMQIQFPYRYMSSIMRLIDDQEMKVVENISEAEVRLVLDSRLSSSKAFKDQAVNITNGEAKISTLEK